MGKIFGDIRLKKEFNLDHPAINKNPVQDK
ncbi:hypothetical protein MNBD_BACTEROID01-1030 [hydrothermal vent metagenome]|uniref:Uncharacterized protein n=1 Tax=hydrothermal vent metagenome TaxID=652676 RepID=A0A3B0UL39_9ZZZZ